MADVNEYGNTSEHSNRELSANFSVDADTDVNETASFVIAANPVNAIWVNAEDFTYSTTDTSIATISGETVTGISVGAAHVIATHKVTGRQMEFPVGVYPGTFELRICASGKLDENSASAGGTWFGHCWIGIVSYSAFKQTIGHYQLVKLGSVTIGKWGSVSCGDNEFGGIWYNREKYRNVAVGAFSEYVYLSEIINKSALNQLSQYILNEYSDYNFWGDNCVHFARDAWNLCVDTTRKIDDSTSSPDAMENIIKDCTGWDTGIGQSIMGNTTHGYYNGTRYVVCNHN